MNNRWFSAGLERTAHILHKFDCNPLTMLAKKHKTDKAAKIEWTTSAAGLSPESRQGFGVAWGDYDGDWLSRVTSVQIYGHNYTHIYYEVLNKFKDKKFNLLELGVGDTGASVKMWKEFFPNANITLFDPFFITNPEVTVTAEELRDLGIEVVIGNQLCPEDLLKLIKNKNYKFDVIIDDASHVSDGVQITLATLLPYLSDDGYYFVEDLSSARERDAKISEVNNWLDGPDVDQQIEKQYHRKEIHIMDSLDELATSGFYKSDILSEQQKSYLEENIKYFACYEDFDGRQNLVLIKKIKPDVLVELPKLEKLKDISTWV